MVEANPAPEAAIEERRESSTRERTKLAFHASNYWTFSIYQKFVLGKRARAVRLEKFCRLGYNGLQVEMTDKFGIKG
ncbi:MAG: hypothetical protein ABIH70_07485 [Chloroflexota bacterium]